MQIASCPVGAVVCNDTGGSSALSWTSAAIGAAVLLVLLGLAVLLVRHVRRRPRRLPSRCIRVDRHGNVVETGPPHGPTAPPTR